MALRLEKDGGCLSKGRTFQQLSFEATSHSTASTTALGGTIRPFLKKFVALDVSDADIGLESRVATSVTNFLPSP
jgi:hypothetical protein